MNIWLAIVMNSILITILNEIKYPKNTFGRYFLIVISMTILEFLIVVLPNIERLNWSAAPYEIVELFARENGSILIAFLIYTIVIKPIINKQKLSNEAEINETKKEKNLIFKEDSFRNEGIIYSDPESQIPNPNSNSKFLDTEDEKITLNTVKELIDKSQFSDALSILNNILANNSHNSSALILRSQVKKSLNDPKGSKEDLDLVKILVNKLDKALSYHKEAVNECLNENYVSSLSLFEKAISLGVETATTNFYLGECKRNIGQFDEALKYYINAINKDGNFYRAYEEIGLLYLNHFHDYDNAVTYFSKWIEKDPTNVDAYSNRAAAHFKNERDADGLNDLTTAISLEDTDPANWANRAIKYIELERYNDALSDLEMIFKRNLELPDKKFKETIISLIAQVKFINKDFNGSIDSYSKLILMNPNNLDAYFERADSYFYANKFNESVEDLTFVINNEPKNGMAYFRRSLSYEKLDMFDESFEDREKSIEFGFDEDEA